MALLENALGEGNPNKSCGEFGALNRVLLIAQLTLPGFVLPLLPPQPIDPRVPNLVCSPMDGHGETMGYRGLTASGPVGHGTQAQGAWPCYHVRGHPVSHRVLRRHGA